MANCRLNAAPEDAADGHGGAAETHGDRGIVQRQLHAIVREVAEQYSVEAAHVLINDGEGRSRVEAAVGELGVVVPGIVDVQKPDLRFLRHDIHWNLPVIIEDARSDERFDNATRHGYCFTVVMPLVVGSSLRCGSLSIVGMKPRARFDLQDCAFLEQKAREVVDVLQQHGVFPDAAGVQVSAGKSSSSSGTVSTHAAGIPCGVEPERDDADHPTEHDAE